MQTVKEQVGSVAAGLGCRSQDLEAVWRSLESKPLPLTAKGMVYQVVTAMKGLDLNPDESQIDRIASRL